MMEKKVTFDDLYDHLTYIKNEEELSVISAAYKFGYGSHPSRVRGLKRGW